MRGRFGDAFGIVLILLAIYPWLFVLVGGMWWTSRPKVERHYPKDPNSRWYGACRTTIDAEQIFEATSLVMWSIKWPKIQQIELTDRFLLFYLSPGVAILIPRRAFADESALEEFVQTARRFHEAARAGAK